MALRPYHTLALCAGAGGLELGVELAVPGARCVAYVEREAYAAGTLVARMETGELAPAPIWSDLATFDARPFRGRVHCVTSGDPCQPNSVAGRGLGQADERFLLDRAIQIYADSGAPRFFRENVTGNADGQLAVATSALERLGCRVAAGIFRASDTGASHQRERLIVMADRDGAAVCGGGPGQASGSAGRLQGQGQERERLRADLGECRSPMAHPGRSDGFAWPDGARGSAGEGAAGELGRSGFELVYATGIRQPSRRTGSDEIATWGGSGRADRADINLGDADRAHVSRRRGGGGQEGRQEPLGHVGLASGSVEPPDAPVICPGPSDLRWLDILDADPLRRPAIGRIDLWAIARRNLGLPPVVAAVGRRGGMAWDLDATTTALVRDEVRRIPHGLAYRVDRLRLCGNGVHPLAAGYAWLALDALLAADAGAGATAVMAA